MLLPFNTAASVAPSFRAKSAGRPAMATPGFHGRTNCPVATSHAPLNCLPALAFVGTRSHNSGRAAPIAARPSTDRPTIHFAFVMQRSIAPRPAHAVLPSNPHPRRTIPSPCIFLSASIVVASFTSNSRCGVCGANRSICGDGL
jgi:hypothetical protein